MANTKTNTASKKIVTTTKPSVVAPKAPALPKKAPANEERDVTDPSVRLTKEEREALTPEQKKARRKARNEKRGPVRARFEKQIIRMAKNTKRVAARLEGSDASDEAKSAVLALTHLAAALAKLPEDWTPVGSRAAAAPVGDVEVDGKAMVRTKRHEEYKEFFEDLGADVSDPYQVTKVTEKLVFLKVGKTVIPMPRNHVRAA